MTDQGTPMGMVDGGVCDWRFGWPSSLDGGLGSLGRGEFTGSELVTLLDRDGEVGSKRH